MFRRHCEEHPEIVTDAFKRAIYEMFRQGVALEDRFIDLSFALGGPRALTPEEVKQYIGFIADRRLV